MAMIDGSEDFESGEKPVEDDVSIFEFIAGDIDAGDDDALDADFTETMRPAPVAEPVPPGVIYAEPVSDEFSEFLASLPGDTMTTIVVTRHPDRNYAGDFRIPCDTSGHKDTVYWKHPKTAEEIYSDIQKTHGGGIYQFQVRQGRGFGKGTSWSQLIHDPASPSIAEQTIRGQTEKAKEQEHERIPDASPQFAIPVPAPPLKSSFEEMRDRLREAQEIREMLGIDGRSEPQPLSADEQIKLKVFDKLGDNPDFHEKLIDYGFGLFKRKEEKTESWIDLAKHAMKNPNDTMQLVAGVLSMGKGLLFSGGPQPPAIPRPSLNITMPPTVRAPIVPHTQPAPPVSGIVMPQAGESPSTVPETRPEAVQQPAAAIKKVEW